MIYWNTYLWWLAQSLDLIPIENLCSVLDVKLKDRKPSNRGKLFQMVGNCWLSC